MPASFEKLPVLKKINSIGQVLLLVAMVRVLMLSCLKPCRFPFYSETRFRQQKENYLIKGREKANIIHCTS